MARTQNRPMPAGRLSRQRAAAFGFALAVCGVGLLALKTTFVAAGCAGAALAIYLGIYTPLKKRTPLCVEIGAVAGALPPVIGWTALNGSVSLQTAILFGALFAWQVPHVMAIAWMHRHEYAMGKLLLLPRGDFTGRVAAGWALVFSGLLAAITLVPGLSNPPKLAYLAGACSLNSVLLIASARFLHQRSRDSAHDLFTATIIYLPLLLVLMMLL